MKMKQYADYLLVHDVECCLLPMRPHVAPEEPVISPLAVAENNDVVFNIGPAETVR